MNELDIELKILKYFDILEDNDYIAEIVNSLAFSHLEILICRLLTSAPATFEKTSLVTT